MDRIPLTTLAGARKYLEEAIFPASRQIMEEDGEHYPLAFILATCYPGGQPIDDTVTIFPFPFATVAHATGLTFDDRGREVFAQAIQAVAQRTKAAGVIYIAESWIIHRSMSGDAPLLMERPSEAPDRQEILSVILDHRDGRIFCKAPILRDGSAVTLGTFDCEDADTGSYGRFVNLLGRPEPPAPEA